ncbi:UNVERIFIED_CONTAM: hypothetical protein FKN15_074964 [Acipenser sinensis]
MESITLKVHAVVEFSFKDYTIDRVKNKQAASCLHCKAKICEKLGTSSNWKTKHPDRFQCYKARDTATAGQSSITSFMQSPKPGALGGNTPTYYSPKSAQAQAIHESIMMDLVVGESLPLRIVESQGFLNFMQTVDPQYKPLCRQSMKKKITHKASSLKQEITDKLAKCESVNATVDLWSDRRMRSFLGVMAHIIEDDDADEGTTEWTEDDMESSIDAAADLDDNSIWESLEDVDQQELDSLLLNTTRLCRLSCFAHTLQLCVGDGLKQCKGVRSAMSKATRVTVLLHSSTVFKETFEKNFGEGRCIPSPNTTRWNSVLRQMQSIVSLDHQQLSDTCKDAGHVETVLLVSEWAQLKQLVEVLLPFAEATNLTQGEEVPTISLVIPTVLALGRHLQNCVKKAKFLKPLITELQSSIRKRYLGIFKSVGMTEEGVVDFNNSHPFGEAVYAVAAVLDPAFSLQWLVDVNVEDEKKEVIRLKVKELVVMEAESVSGRNTFTSCTSEEDEDKPPHKYTKLFSSYKK